MLISGGRPYIVRASVRPGGVRARACDAQHGRAHAGVARHQLLAARAGALSAHAAPQAEDGTRSHGALQVLIALKYAKFDPFRRNSKIVRLTPFIELQIIKNFSTTSNDNL